jgi:hypothetical protein
VLIEKEKGIDGHPMDDVRNPAHIFSTEVDLRLACQAGETPWISAERLK